MSALGTDEVSCDVPEALWCTEDSGVWKLVRIERKANRYLFRSIHARGFGCVGSRAGMWQVHGFIFGMTRGNNVSCVLRVPFSCPRTFPREHDSPRQHGPQRINQMRRRPRHRRIRYIMNMNMNMNTQGTAITDHNLKVDTHHSVAHRLFFSQRLGVDLR